MMNEEQTSADVAQSAASTDTASSFTATRRAPPTSKYTGYLAEVETGLAGRLSSRERRRLEYEMGLLRRARFVELNGVIHHYQEVGPVDGEPLILVHGWDCSSFWWHHIVDPLAESGYRVITYDLKGHGFSDVDPRQNYTVEGFSVDLGALADALEIESFHVAAFSLGAFVVLHYASQAPERVRSLIFFNFGLLTYNRLASTITPKTLDVVFNGLLRPIERRGLWPVPFVYARLVMAQNTPPVNDIRLGALSLRYCDPAAVKVSAQQLARREVLEAVPQQMQAIHQPLLLVAGSGDPIFRPLSGRKLVDLARRGTFFKMPKCGHLILFELPDQVVQIMRMFLQGSAREG